MASLVKRAASLIVCRSMSYPTSFFDYEVLMLTRQENMQAFSEVLVFPGGKCDQQIDKSIAQKIRVKDYVVCTALRECFEEIGLFFCKDPIFQMQKLEALGQLKLSYIASQLNPSATDLTPFFLRLSEIAQARTNYLPFVRLVTIPLLKKRYDASFFLHKIDENNTINFFKFAQNQKYLHSSSKLSVCEEFSTYQWKNPLQVLRQFKQTKIKLAQPQYMMLAIMSQFYKYSDLQEFLKNCSQNPINMLPNIVSLIRNNGSRQQQFPYAATLVGDHQFPFENIYKNEKSSYLVEELQNYNTGKILQIQNHSKVRLLFKEPRHFFDADYEVECNINGSVFTKMPNSREVQRLIRERC